MLKIVRNCSVLAAKNARLIQTTQIALIDHDWRRKNRLPVNPNTESPLTFLPDFTYMDGRPTPLGKNQKRRVEKQRDLAKHMVKGLDEIQFAEKRYERITKEKTSKRNEAIESKLKPKGFHLFDKKK